MFKIHGAGEGGEAMRIFHFGRRPTLTSETTSKQIKDVYKIFLAPEAVYTVLRFSKVSRPKDPCVKE